MIIGYVQVKPSGYLRADKQDVGTDGWYEIRGVSTPDRVTQAHLGDRLLDFFANNIPLALPEAFAVIPTDASGHHLDYGLAKEEVAEGNYPVDWRIIRVESVCP